VSAPPPVLPPWRWAPHGPYSILFEGSVPRLALLWRPGSWEVSFADGTVIRDGVTSERLPTVLSEIIPRLKLEPRP